jgi:FkbM family methyltransferase
MSGFLWPKIKKALQTMGLDVQRYRPQELLRNTSLEGSLARLQTMGLNVATLIDVGASNGSWALDFEAAFPGVACLMIEANPVHKEALEALCKRKPAFQYEMKAAGAVEGMLYFDSSDPWGGHLADQPLSPSYQPCPVTAIDREVEHHRLKGPFAIKLDTHGVEAPILTGAARTLEQAEIVVIECYNFPADPPQMPFWDMCRWMLERGFRPLDAHGVGYRPHDHAFWQIDIVFARQDRKEFAHPGYR